MMRSIPRRLRVAASWLPRAIRNPVASRGRHGSTSGYTGSGYPSDTLAGGRVPDGAVPDTFNDPRLQRDLEQFGFVVVPFMTEKQLRQVRLLQDRLGAAPDDPRVAINWSFHSASASHKSEVRDTFLPLLRAELDGLLKDHEVFLTTFITKWPGPDSGFAPHQDPTLVDERRFRGITVWIPLGPTGVFGGRDNGMLHFVPGSHLFSSALRVSDVDRSPLKPHQERIVSDHGVGVGTAPGEAIVFDNRTIHFSMPNLTDEPRVVLSFGVRPREARCVLLREKEDRLEMFEIHDEFYTDVLPASQHSWAPPGDPIARLSQPRTSWTADEFAEMCRNAPKPELGWRVSDEQRSWHDPGIFCARCGNRDGLTQIDRSNHNNAQLLCFSCSESLHGTQR